MRYFHSCCINMNGNRYKSWKCPLCANKETEVVFDLKPVPSRSSQNCSGMCERSLPIVSEVALLDTVVSHKKRDTFALKVRNV